MNSVVVKLGLSILFLLLVILFPLGYVVNTVFSTFYYQKAFQEMESQGNKLVQLINNSDVSFAPSIILAMSMVDNGTILVDASKRTIAKENTTFAVGDILTNEDWLALQKGMSLTKNWSSPGYSLVGKPIIKNGTFDGAVIMITPTQEIESSIAQIRNVLFFIGFGGILLALGFTVILVRKLSVPLLNMERVTRQIAKGDLGVRISPQSNDEIGSLAQAINDLASHLKRYEDTRKEFFANISHELRTPLTYIEGYVRLLDESQSQEERKQTIQIISDETKRLKGLVDDLFDLSKLEEGKISLILEWLDVSEVAESAMAKVRFKAEQKGITLSFHDEGVPLMHLDGNRMQQVFLNLLDNAIRYTEKGTISLNMMQDQQHVTIQVTDTGVGIPPEELPYIFERFHRVEKSRSREHGGTGLGLAIVKKLIELQGGQIEAVSKVGFGTTFIITFPLPNGELKP